MEQAHRRAATETAAHVRIKRPPHPLDSAIFVLTHIGQKIFRYIINAVRSEGG